MTDRRIAARQQSVPLILPLKSRRRAIATNRNVYDEDEADHNGARRKRHNSTPLVANPTSAMLAAKRQAHKFYQNERQRSGRQIVAHRIIEGPQLDPFDSFPIASTPDVPRMAQYFVQRWAPEHGTAFAMDGYPNPYLSILWPYAMQNDIYFEALVALCLATWMPGQGVDARTDRAFLYHRSNVVTKLRDRLASPQQCADDCTTLTVATLGTIDYVLGAHETASAHIDGVRQIMKMRSAQPSATDPFHRLIEINVKAFEDLWAFVTETTTPTEEEPNPMTMLKQGVLPTYMVHPFPPEVCTMMSRLPRGFCDLGLKGMLSLQMIKILTSLNDKPQNGPNTATFTATYPLTPESAPSPVDSDANHKLRYLREILQDLHRMATLKTTLTEHILCYGLIAHCYTIRHVFFRDNFGAFYTSVVDTLTQKCLRHDPESEGLDRKCYLWCSVVIATTLMNISYSATSRFVIFEHLFSKYREVREWKMLHKLMDEFFWVEELQDLVYRSWQEAKDWMALPESQRRVQTKKPTGMSIRDVIL